MATGRKHNLVLSPELDRFLLQQVEAGGLGTPSEYMRHLLRRALVASTVDEIDAKLIASKASGPAFHPTRKDWADLAKRADKRLADLRKRGLAPRRRSA